VKRIANFGVLLNSRATLSDRIAPLLELTEFFAKHKHVLAECEREVEQILGVCLAYRGGIWMRSDVSM
jgi:hypothetical protein